MAVGRYAGFGMGINTFLLFRSEGLGRVVLGRRWWWMWPGSKCFISVHKDHEL